MGARFEPSREALAKLLGDAAIEVSMNSVGVVLDDRVYRAKVANWMYDHAREYDILIDYYGGQ